MCHPRMFGLFRQMLDRHRGFVGRTTKIGYSLHLAREALLVSYFWIVDSRCFKAML